MYLRLWPLGISSTGAKMGQIVADPQTGREAGAGEREVEQSMDCFVPVIERTVIAVQALDESKQ